MDSRKMEFLLDKLKKHNNIDKPPEDISKLLEKVHKSKKRLGRTKSLIRSVMAIKEVKKMSTMDILAQKRYASKRAKYFRYDHPLIKDWKFMKKEERHKYKYFLEDNPLVHTLLKQKQIENLSEHYTRDLKEFKFEVPELSSPDD